VTIDVFKQASQTSKLFAFLRTLTESTCRDRSAYKWSGGNTASTASRHVSQQPGTFDRLRKTRPNVLSCPIAVANLASQEGSIDRTNYNSQAAAAGPCSRHFHGGAIPWWRNVQIRSVPRPSIAAKGDCIVAPSHCCMAAHLRIAMVLCTIGFVDRARKPTLSNLGPGAVL
jgi:hypothetical protein